MLATTSSPPDRRRRCEDRGTGRRSLAPGQLRQARRNEDGDGETHDVPSGLQATEVFLSMEICEEEAGRGMCGETACATATDMFRPDDETGQRATPPGGLAAALEGLRSVESASEGDKDRLGGTREHFLDAGSMEIAWGCWGLRQWREKQLDVAMTDVERKKADPPIQFVLLVLCSPPGRTLTWAVGRTAVRLAPVAPFLRLPS